MKSSIQRILQSILGFRTYLFIFSIFKIFTLRYDKGEKDFFYFLSLLKSDRDALDIGANIGIMSTKLAHRISGATLHAFEPVPDNLHALKRISKFFGVKNIEIHPVALGNEQGEIEMVLPEVNSVKKQGLSHVVHEDITEFNEGHKFTVPLYRLDDFPAIQDADLQAIKIDVENFEYQVFLGAEKIINKSKPYIYCELWDNDNRYKCFDLLKSWGYDVKVLDSSGKQLVLYDKNQHTTQNFFFVPAIN